MKGVGRGPKGRLTELIMSDMPEELPAATYNRIYEAVHRGLANAAKVKVAICPDNDEAFFALFVTLPRTRKRMIMALADALVKEVKRRE